MNSIWNKNIESFKIRFPQLAEMLGNEITEFCDSLEQNSLATAGCAGLSPLHAHVNQSHEFSTENSLATAGCVGLSPSQASLALGVFGENSGTNKICADFSPLEIIEAKNGEPTVLENKIPLHSKYNPSREANQIIQKNIGGQTPSCAVFLSFGLGYVPIDFAKNFPSIPIVIVESHPKYLFTAFSVVDWTPVLSHSQVIFAITTDSSMAASLCTSFGSQDVKFFSTTAQTSHNQIYFDEVKAHCQRSKQKEEINTNTLEKFSHLWLKNSCRNLPFLAEKDGVKKYFNSACDIPFVIIAAGPSLEKVLPHLQEMKKKSVIVCVDTALKACLSVGVEPDFIVLVDPQYVCALHLEFLESPSSVLITESAAWPSVFRFKCKEIVLCSSLFPIGQFFEKQLGNKGELGAGGSVTTTAWDFARKCGARQIFLAGMDLGFPGKQTHIRGSQFEERSHRTSKRTNPGETDGINALLGANPKVALDYNGDKLLTDSRMSMFSWWFENSVSTAKLDNQKTYTLTAESLAIKGIEKIDLDSFLKYSDIIEEKRQFFNHAAEKSIALKKDCDSNYKNVLESFVENLSELDTLAKKGLQLCKKGFADPTKVGEIYRKLQEIDNQILTSKAKDAAALVFPTQRQLDRLSKDLPQGEQRGQTSPLFMSQLIYSQIQKAVREYQQALGAIL